MLYVLFFRLRDGASLAARIERALPLADDDKRALLETVVTVIRATVKGGVVMAATQGVLRGVVLGWLDIRNPLFWGVATFGLDGVVIGPMIAATLLAAWKLRSATAKK